MFQLSNDTPFAAERAIQLDPQGVQHWVVVVKATYELDPSGRFALHAKQEPVCLAPKHAGEPGRSSLLRESEIAYFYRGTDVIINATAHAPGGRPVDEMDVRVAAGPLRKNVRVLGERVWVATGTGLVASRPVPFTRMPITYERAFGGIAPDDAGSFEERNPVGRGYSVHGRGLQDQHLPNVEDPALPIRSPRDRPPPAGLGFVAGHWSPRNKLAGTYDDAWQARKLPLLPDDFDPQFYAAASTGLYSPAAFQGGEQIFLDGVSPSGGLYFSVPREVLMVDTWLGRDRVRQAVQLYRIIIEPEEQRLITVWASSLRCGTRFRDIARTRIDYKPRIAA